MIKEPYRSARRVFWVLDNGSDHRGQASIDRLQGRWRNLILVHLPIHASWLNQVEIYHSIIQRKVLDPNDFTDTAEVARTLNQFERRYSQIAKPFDWNFTRQDLAEVVSARHKALAVESVVIDYSDRGEVQRVSGQGLVPVIDDDGTMVVDSMEIVRYLEDWRRTTDGSRATRSLHRQGLQHRGSTNSGAARNLPKKPVPLGRPLSVSSPLERRRPRCPIRCRGCGECGSC